MSPAQGKDSSVRHNSSQRSFSSLTFMFFNLSSSFSINRVQPARPWRARSDGHFSAIMAHLASVGWMTSIKEGYPQGRESASEVNQPVPGEILHEKRVGTGWGGG